MMYKYILVYLSIFAICVAAKKRNKNKNKNKQTKEPEKTLVDVLLADGGKWILAAAASTYVPPPFKSCTRITVTPLRYKSWCIVSNLNLTARKVRRVKFVGTNDYGEIEIQSTGPINEYTIKRRNEAKVHASLKNEMDWEAAVNQPICWARRPIKPRSFVTYRYVITPVDMTNTAIYLVGVKKRMPVPEYEVAILTKKIRKRAEVQKMIHIMNWKNFDKMDGCREQNLVWPPSWATIPWYWNFYVYCLPRMHLKCAEGYNVRNLKDPSNHRTPHQIFRGIKASFKSAETTSIMVVHK